MLISKITFRFCKNRGGWKFLLNPAAGSSGKPKKHPHANDDRTVLLSTITSGLYKNRGTGKFILNSTAAGGGGKADRAEVSNNIVYAKLSLKPTAWIISHKSGGS